MVLQALRKRSWFPVIARVLTLPAIILVVKTSTALACDECNAAIYRELLSSRKGTLVGDELVRAISNQQGPAFVSDQSMALAGVNKAKLLASVPGVAQGATPPIKSNTYAAGGEEKPKKEFIEIIKRDKALPIPATGYVPQDTPPTTKVSIDLMEGEAYLGKGVFFKGFTTNGTVPGPTIVVEEGDIVEFTVNNKGAIPHGASIHSAYTQTSKYLGKIPAGESRKMVFKVTYPGVYMYHCAPGGHAIPMHVLFGQYGMMVVKPKKQYQLEKILGKKPDVEINLLQHEWYANGKDAIEGKPMYVTFNGKLFRYVEEPIKAKPGDYVRINFLNVGPNLLSTFHIVGIIWDFAYWQGHPEAVFKGGQSVTAGPTDSWVIEFRMPPDEGAYLMLSHAVGSTDRGAIGILAGDRDAKTPLKILSDGPALNEDEMKEMKSKSVRTISPFEPGSPDVDVPEVIPDGQREAIVRIIGNSYYPKVINVASGTTVRWIQEEVFTYMDGEFAGFHNVVGFKGPETFASPLLAHAESYSQRFTKPGEYEYMCTPHPYMRGKVIVRK